MTSLSILLLLSSCDGYRNTPLGKDTISAFNQELMDARKNGAAWANTPEDIARYQFPPVSHDSGPKLYKISKKDDSSEACTVTITEEGPIDDEVTGIRHTLYFNKSHGLWLVRDMKYEVKRRP